jgi:hypothetical protein
MSNDQKPKNQENKTPPPPPTTEYHRRSEERPLNHKDQNGRR